jgi:hypothetical protein
MSAGRDEQYTVPETEKFEGPKANSEKYGDE